MTARRTGTVSAAALVALAAAVGIAHAAGLARDVVAGGAPGVHLYAFNSHDTVLAVLRDAGILTHPLEQEAAR